MENVYFNIYWFYIFLLTYTTDLESIYIYTNADLHLILDKKKKKIGRWKLLSTLFFKHVNVLIMYIIRINNS